MPVFGKSGPIFEDSEEIDEQGNNCWRYEDLS